MNENKTEKKTCLSDIIKNNDIEKLEEKNYSLGINESENNHLSDIIKNNDSDIIRNNDTKNLEKLINSFNIIEDENIEEKINLTQNKRELNWNLISLNHNLSEKSIEKYEKFIIWNNISMGKKFTFDFLEKYREKLDWSYIWQGPNLSDDLVNKFHEYFTTLNIPTGKLIKLKFPTIHLIKNKINWYYVSQYRGLPKNFMKEFSRELYWPYISEWSKFVKPEDLN